MDHSLPETDRTEIFLRLLGEHERNLSLYLSSVVACQQDAQDIFQEARIVMWREFPRFEIGTNFASWGRRILFFQILSHRRKAQRNQGQTLSENVLELLAEEAETAVVEERWNNREQQLQICVSRLSPPHREILELRYLDEFSIERIARRTERSEGAVYRLLSRLRKNLYHCVEKQLARS